MMDFFAAQERARRRSRWLLVALAASVLSIAALLYGVVAYVAQTTETGSWLMPDVFVTILGAVAAVVGLGFVFKLIGLRAGGERVAEWLGGTLVERSTSAPDERQLINIVEEMAIASGVPVPPCYVLEGEASINAFAAGYQAEDAIVAVTRGALDQLTRDELQGVMAHEFSHVLNGDMRLNLRLVAVVAGLMGIALIGRTIINAATHLRSSKDSAQARLALWSIGGVLAIVGFLGVLFGRIIQAAVSRQREHLADASAVQFTRNPDGIRAALIRIGQYPEGSWLKQAGAAEIHHALFAQGFRSGWFSGLFATHPPLERRIEALGGVRLAEPRTTTEPAPSVSPSGSAAAGFASIAAAPPPTETLFDATALACALIMAPQRTLSSAQAARLERAGTLGAAAQSYHPSVHQLGLDQQLELLDKLAPTLRRLSAAQGERVHKLALDLASTDGRISAFECAVLVTLRRRLNPTSQAPASRKKHPWQAIGVVLSAIAHQSDAPAPGAFERARQRMSSPRARRLQLLPIDDCSSEHLLKAYTQLAEAPLPLRQAALEGIAAAAAADAVLNTDEQAFVRASCSALGTHLVRTPQPPGSR